MMWNVGQGGESKMCLVVMAFECQGATVSFYSWGNTKVMSQKKQRLQTVKIEIYMLLDSTSHAPVWRSLYFLLSDIMCHDMIWYDMKNYYYCIFFLYNRCRWGCSRLLLKGLGLLVYIWVFSSKHMADTWCFRLSMLMTKRMCHGWINSNPALYSTFGLCLYTVFQL